MEVLQSKWNDILLTIKNEYSISNIAYNTFLEPLEVFAIDDDILYILYNSSGEDQMSVSYITRKYTQFFQVVIAETTGQEYIVKFISLRDANTIGLHGAAAPAAPAKSDIPFGSENYRNSNLNPRYTFDNFVVGESNRFAQASSLAVAESPGEAYNPLYIYGGPGLGKTHLMHSIGNHMFEQDSNKKVLYVTSEYFVNEVIESIRSANSATRMSKLRDKYRKVDVLMIDDIQFLIGKESTQEEFFHTFNALHEAGKQIILTSDRPPKDLETLEERIRTRLGMGLPADVGEPSFETRKALILNKIKNDGIEFSEDVVDYIAENIVSNVREIEGAINKLVAYRNLQNIDINLDIAKRELANIISHNKTKEITAQYIIEEVANYYNLTMEQMISKDRKKTIARPRQVAMYLCQEMLSTPSTAIGKLLGDRNHATIIHGAKKISDELKTDNDLRWDIDKIKNQINPQ